MSAKSKKPYKRFSDEEKKGILEDYFQSNLSVEAYCKNAPVCNATLRKWIKKATQKSIPNKKHYSPEQRKEAVEQYMKSGMTQKEFASVWGINPRTINVWFKTYQREGPQGLWNGKIFGKGKKRGREELKQEVKDVIVETKKRLPQFGLKKLKDFLYRFEGVKVSPNSIKKVLVEEEIYEPPKAPPKKKSPPLPRRFERANPMQLWQSDITSFVLKRSGQRVYLVVFKDDHSRYIVSWALALKQTGAFVMECFLDGVQKFGKPQEVLTDQGRQYFSWRGQSEFQKLLTNEGVRHVVSRSHHPQTLGKCERFWKTVGIEFWNRAKPLDLKEARDRFAHYVNHYNHFRPHQGIGGVTPADRFFGVENQVREAIENNLTNNELRLSIDQMPRKPFYFVGQVGEKRVAIHGEKGKLKVNMPDGETTEIDYENFGNGYTESSRKYGSEGREYCEEKERQEGATQRELQDATENSNTSERALGSCERTREEACPPKSDNDHGVLDGTYLERGSGSEIRDASTSNLADESTSYLGNVCGTFETTKESEEYDEQRRRSKIPEEEDSGTREEDLYARSFDRDSEVDARLQGSDVQRGTCERESERVEEETSEESRSETWQEAQDERDTTESSRNRSQNYWYNKDDD
ncbi:MAG: DDE-type integrase/transposase/recombinase [Oligoflexia bacterium]|nr:DDE-type integrase/transposase/recombinase [Bacteroidota bacterium]MCP4912160.1 DDE-type integrase/transposase/recombinase [Oligoflexia bacterium]